MTVSTLAQVLAARESENEEERASPWLDDFYGPRSTNISWLSRLTLHLSRPYLKYFLLISSLSQHAALYYYYTNILSCNVKCNLRRDGGRWRQRESGRSVGDCQNVIYLSLLTGSEREGHLKEKERILLLFWLDDGWGRKKEARPPALTE